MCKKSVSERQLKRERTIKKYAVKRAELKKRANDLTISNKERLIARRKFQALPRDSSPVRSVRRCRLTGRPRGVYRLTGLARTKLREITMQGFAPGLRKASW